MESLQLPSKMPADYTRNNRNRIIPAGFVDGPWWAIHGGDSCCSPRHRARGKWQCLHCILGLCWGKWLSLPPELHRAASYLIRGAPVRKPCRMKPHLHIYLPSFKTTTGTTKKTGKCRSHSFSVFSLSSSTTSEVTPPVFPPPSGVAVPPSRSNQQTFLVPSSITSLVKTKENPIYLPASVKLGFVLHWTGVNELPKSPACWAQQSKLLLARAECDLVIDRWSECLRGQHTCEGSSPTCSKGCRWKNATFRGFQANPFCHALLSHHKANEDTFLSQ